MPITASKDSSQSSNWSGTVKMGSKISGPLSSPRRPPPEFPDLLGLTSSFKGIKLRPRHDPEPWEADGDRPKEPHGNIWFDIAWKARTVALSPDQRGASWNNSSYGGFLTSAQMLRKTVYGRFFEVRIEQVDSTWSDGFGIGVGVHPSLSCSLEPDLGGFYEGLAWESMPHSWMLGYDGRVKIQHSSRYLTSREMLGVRWQTSKLQCGDRVGLLASHDGHLMLFVNDHLTYLVSYCEIPWANNPPLHALVDLDGSIRAVELTGRNGIPSPQILDFLCSLRETEFQRYESLEDLRASEMHQVQTKALST